MLGVVPAAGAGRRMQPLGLGFSKELLPLGETDGPDGRQRPLAVSDHVVERMIEAGADRICFVIAPGKSDIIEHHAGGPFLRRICYVVQERPSGLCDAIFRAAPLAARDEDVLIGLPDTVWFPRDGFALLPEGELGLLLFRVEHPERFDAVLTSEDRVTEIRVKARDPGTDWIWGAIRLPASRFQELAELWREPGRGDEYLGTLLNEHIRRGGVARGVKRGESYVDVGSVDDYLAALARPLPAGPRARVTRPR